MANPSVSRVIVIADGVNASIGLSIAANGSFTLGRGATMTRPSASLVVNVADKTDPTRLMRFS